MRVLVPDLVWKDGAFQAGLAVEVDPGTGRITAVRPPDSLPPGLPLERLTGRALLPGFVNAHSHSFQRLLRGRGQTRPAREGADFWSWRSAMYETAAALSPEDIADVARFCFIEMLRAGWTAVGEFHYLHNDPAGRPYARPFELAERVIEAAVDVGIRIRLLNVAYVTGGIGEPLRSEQRRFATPDLERYLRGTIDLVESIAAHPLASAGVAPHSIRAVPLHWLRPIHAMAYGFDLPFHMHASEQPAEVSACLSAYGRRPIEVVAEQGVVDDLFTAVHATHITHNEIALLSADGPHVCACPTTERDLGDGFLAGEELVRGGARLALGTDSQMMIDPFAEMRLLEYHERLRKLRRVVLARDEGDGTMSAAGVLLDAATAGGARSLRIDSGTIATGALADLVAIDLGHRALAGADARSLADILALAAPAGVVSDVWVNGVRRVQEAQHPREREAQEAFRRVAAAIGAASAGRERTVT